MFFNPQTSKVFFLGRKLNTNDLFGVNYCGNFKSIHKLMNYRIPRVITDDAMLPNYFNYCNVQMRWGHTDIKIPDFKPYRRRSTRKENAKNSLTEVPRKAFTYAIGAGSVIVSLYSAKSIVLFLVSFMGMSADVLAIAQIEIKLSDVPEGSNVTYKWRGKPLFVRHRTQFEIDQTRAVDIHTLRDPEKDEDRCPKPEWLVVIGVCTHLGCIPIANLGDFPGGYYCPCHGSHFDGAGRARKGPAPLNLEIPEHVFKDENTLVVG